jgi:O-acetyl-ADP-ribose deacetylase (regulator of RNase III)
VAIFFLLKPMQLSFQRTQRLLPAVALSGHFHKEAWANLEKVARLLGPLKPGNSVVTAGFELQFSLVVHAVAPRYVYDTAEEETLLRQMYLSVFKQKALQQVKSVVFPAVGIHVHGWPISLATSIAVTALKESPFEKNDRLSP